jgi:hypothetical protein
MKLVIPDIHLKYPIADKILNKWSPEKIIFLGDYFDDFYDNPKKNMEMAYWLKEKTKQYGDKLIKLMGNHDMHYRFMDNFLLRCSGFTPQKCVAINQVLTKEDWAEFKLFHYEDGIYFSHAGISPHIFAHPIKGLTKLGLETQCEEALKACENGDYSMYIGAGRSRGGRQPYGGITWLDFDDEFEPIPNINQCFGHTPHGDPQYSLGENSQNFALDTHLRHYGVLRDGGIEILHIDD